MTAGNMAGEDLRTNLIINYLHHSTTDEDLRSLFSTVGAVESARVILDRVKGHSLQYGFVNYVHHADAARAVETLNRQKLQSKPIKVSYAQKHRNSPAATKAFVDGLLQTATLAEEELQQRFSSLILNDQDMAAEEEEAVGKQQPNDQQPSPGASNQQAGETSLTTIKQEIDHQDSPCVSDLHVDQAVEHFRQLQLQFMQLPTVPSSAVDQCTVKQEAEEVEIKQPIDLEPFKLSVCKSLHPQATVTSAQWEHRSDVKAEPGSHNRRHHHHHQGGTDNRVQLRRAPRIFIYNLGPDVDEDVLLQLFGNFGEVTDIKVIRDLRTNKCRGLAFVTMATYKQASMACLQINGQKIGDNIVHVSFKIQDDRRRARQTNHQMHDLHHKERAVFKLSDDSIRVTVANKKRARYTLDDLERDGHNDSHHLVFKQQGKRQRAARIC